MNVAVPKEMTQGERRVALTPDVAARIVKAGNTVAVQSGAGDQAGFRDADYQAAGATITPTAADTLRSAELTAKVQRPLDDELALLPQGSALTAFLQPLSSP